MAAAETAPGDIEIRLHGRGGQGGVTCAKIIAAVFAGMGKSVQTFGDYAGERSGAPVRAYTRVSEQPIGNRNKVYRPHHVLVLDATLLGDDAVAGLAAGGTLLVNTAEPPEALGARYGRFRVATVDATAIARRHGIGTRSVVIVNTTIAGAFVKVLGIPPGDLEGAYARLGFGSNLPAAMEAFDAVRWTEAGPGQEAPAPAGAPGAVAAPGRPDVPALEDLLVSPPTPLHTGNWRSQTPAYAQHLAPCSAWCPAGNDVIGFVRTLASEGEAAAAAVLGRTTMLAATCGRICAAPCMEGCNRREMDGAVNIRALERYIADRAPAGDAAVAACDHPRSVAIVGGGPAGLSAAYTLARLGHRVTLLDAEARLGGLLRTGIPSYRLPKDVLDRDVSVLDGLGVTVQSGRRVTRQELPELAAAHDAVILCTGLQTQRELRVPGRELAGIEQGLAFLARVNAGSAARPRGHVVVLGGGNTALDCARSARRLGAARVTIAYRRSFEEMPAIREEIEQAREEGIGFDVLRAPVAFEGNGRVESIVLADVELGEPDDTGRRRPVVTDRRRRLPCDHVLLALGQSADLAILPAGWTVAGGQVMDGGGAPLRVFVAGDFHTGDGTVTHAIGDGRRAATRALAALGVAVTVFERPSREDAVPVTDLRLDHFAPAPPGREAHEPAEERHRTFVEVSRGLPDALESHRCFSCGSCTRCDTCLVYCPEGVVRRQGAGYEIDYSYCKGCGICVEECPRSAIEMRAS